MAAPRIEAVAKGGPAWRAGIRPGDLLKRINGDPVRDAIDYMFHASGSPLTLEISREGQTMKLTLELDEGEDPGIELEEFRIRTCTNKCVFCFVGQLPRGLRRTLYVKDEDYRMSFLYGNYVTLTNMGPKEMSRIIEQRLSPLYISVHATDTEVRRVLLGNPKAEDVMGPLRFFAKNRIAMHTQIVLCPGYNDRKVLRQTLRDLTALHPWVESVAVVPVGLTTHRKVALKPVTADDAADALDMIEGVQQRMIKRHGIPVVYGADELYIKAAREFPQIEMYADLPQIENGVGLVPQFRSEARSIRLMGTHDDSRRILTFTGVSFHPYLMPFIKRLRKKGVEIDAQAVENHMFGESVTVTGLLTGRDIVSALRDIAGNYDRLLVPSVVLREGEEVLLDDMTVRRDRARARRDRNRYNRTHTDGAHRGDIAQMNISGSTKVIALLGHPVGHSLSPAMQNAAFGASGQDFCYVTFDVEPAAMNEAMEGIRALGLAGCNVTVPHKQAVMEHLENIDSTANEIGAVNTIVNRKGRLHGFNTDGDGFMRSLAELDIDVADKRVLIVGAGGAARGIGYKLVRKAGSLEIYNRTEEKSARLADELNSVRQVASYMETLDDLSGFDLILNATSLGLRPGDELPLDPALLRPGQVVGDLIYKQTPLLEAASKMGLKTFDGTGMLLWQGALAFELWTGTKAPVDVMRRALLDAIAAR